MLCKPGKKRRIRRGIAIYDTDRLSESFFEFALPFRRSKGKPILGNQENKGRVIIFSEKLDRILEKLQVGLLHFFEMILRSRIIILATDNDLYGDYYVSLEEASDLCKKHKVKVYGIAPEEVAKEDEYKSSVEKTGGKYYKYTSKEVIEELISDISKTDKSDLDMIETVMYDKPETFFWMMLICLAAYFTLSRIVKK